MSIPKPRRFLVTPLWQQFKRGYSYISTLRWSRLRREVRFVIWVALISIVAYILVAITGAIAIYHSHKQNRFTDFVERIFPYPAANVDGTLIPLSRFRTEVRARQFYASTHNIATTDAETEQFVMNQLIARTFYQKALSDAGIKIDEAQLQEKLDEIYEQAGSKEKLEQFLLEQYGPEATIELFTTWMREAAIENAFQQEILVHASISHILIAAPENATAEAKEAAKKKIDEIKTAITDPSQFSDIAKARSEDTSSRDKGGDFGITNKGDEQPILSTEFENAIFSLPIGQVSDPILTPYGWHLILVNKRDGSIDLSKKAYIEQQRANQVVRTYITD